MEPYRDPELAIEYEDLILKADMFKSIVNMPTNKEVCYNEWINENPVVNIKMISNQDYTSGYPAGSDLSGLLSFEPAPNFTISFDKEEILDEVVNTSEYNLVFCSFNTPPALLKLHSFIMIWELEDGTFLQSPPIKILLQP